VTAGRGIDAYSDWEISRIVQWIKSDGRLRSEDELLAAVMSDLGFERRGSKIVGRILGVIRYLEGRPKYVARVLRTEAAFVLRLGHLGADI
jgi:hypothetical protein